MKWRLNVQPNGDHVDFIGELVDGTRNASGTLAVLECRTVCSAQAVDHDINFNLDVANKWVRKANKALAFVEAYREAHADDFSD